MNNLTLKALAVAALVMLGTAAAHADAITDWNAKTGEFIAAAKIGTPPAVRVQALVQTAALDALGNSGILASAEAAVAAAHRATLAQLLPAQKAAIDAAYQAALQSIADGPAKTHGIAAGEKAAADVLARRADDKANTPERYRPHTSAPGTTTTSGAPSPRSATATSTATTQPRSSPAGRR